MGKYDHIKMGKFAHTFGHICPYVWAFLPIRLGIFAQTMRRLGVFAQPYFISLTVFLFSSFEIVKKIQLNPEGSLVIMLQFGLSRQQAIPVKFL